MIETKVPMDIRSYKAKLIGPFTTRQLICITLCVILDIMAYFFVISPLQLGLRPAIIVLTLLDVPIMAFTIEPMHMPMEQYVRHVLLRSLIAPVKRKAKSDPKLIPTMRDPVYTKQELKQSQKRMRGLLKEHPEFHAYK